MDRPVCLPGQHGTPTTLTALSPQRDHEAIALMDTRVHESGHGTPGCGEPLCELDFEPRDLGCYGCHPGKHVTRQQPHGELVRVMPNDRVANCQAKR